MLCAGDEYDYVILSTVRSLPLKDIDDPRLVEADKHWKRENLGFLTDDHLINVAITRAKQGLIIIGEFYIFYPGLYIIIYTIHLYR